jgi:autotransporter passenger strand-loop-strand repeat protein
MTDRKSIHIVIAAIGLLSVLSLGVSINTTVNAQGSQEKFTAKLTAKEEVPPNDSPATGIAWVKTSEKEAGFEVNVTDIDKATAAHIHLGEKGKNGPVVVTLFKSDTPTEMKNGTLGEGNFTATNFEGPMKGKGLNDLVTAMKNGSTYVNVHTTDMPDGEIRGQQQANSTG